MKLNTFLKLCFEKDIFPSVDVNGMHERTFYRRVAELTGYIDYGCDFDDRGRCFLHHKENYNDSNMCCCLGCRRNIGYLKDLDPDHLNEYALNYRKDTGFWRKTGCALPRQLRSPICLLHSCRSVKVHTKPNTSMILETLIIMNADPKELLSRIMYNSLQRSAVNRIRKNYTALYNLFRCNPPNIERKREIFIRELEEENR